MKANRIIDEEIYGFKVKDMLESLLIPIKIKNQKIRDIELDNESITLMEEFAKRLSEKLDRKPSAIYKLASKIPISYRIMPSTVRNRILRIKAGNTSIDYVGKLKLEKIRLKFLEKIGYSINGSEEKGICIITHDVESEKGLRRALKLKEVEEKYEIESTWFLLTEEYSLDKKIVKRLAESGEIALHGDKHEAKFYNLKKDKIVERLKKGKEKLEEVAEKEVIGFRAPLLQYNKKILEAVSEAGFKYDSSAPAWEPLNPLTMKQDGIELLNPIKINGIMEMPITLVQDHQMFYILKFKPEQTIEQWIEKINEIEKLGGISVLLIHPDYELANNKSIRLYEDLLKKIKQMVVSISSLSNIQDLLK
jgi:peptidoglycan/xylan/chitin deacetylase (PgdA/CDA1 family)